MASNLANLLFSAVGGTKPAQPAAPKAAPADKERFADMLDTPLATPRGRADTQANAATGERRQSGGRTDAPADKANAGNGKVAAAREKEDGEKKTRTASPLEALLAALATLGLQPQSTGLGEGAEQIALDAKALEDIDGALQDLSQLLGIDLKTLMQQLGDFAKGMAAEGGQPDLMNRLTALLGGEGKLGPDVEASINKLMDGLGKLAQALPSEPELAQAQLKLTEPVLAGKTAADALRNTSSDDEKKTSTPELKPTEKLGDSQRVFAGGDAAEPVQGAAKKADNQSQAARPNAGVDDALNLTATTPGQADATAPKLDASAAPRVVQSGYQTSQQQLNLPQIAFELSRQVQDGNSRFQIRLDPPELGRIDVKLDIDSNGQVHAKLTVEKAETLDLMQRDQRALERALQQAGLDGAKTNLEFSLKQNPFAGDQNERSGRDTHTGAEDSGEDVEAAVPAVTLYRGNLSASGLNIIA
ncbi:hook-length control protein FliK [Devosia crocina]|uniref:Hook-length control protein FliK n=1 Tax=Devosia crocina TaxID=429728 RepID=A0A1I7MYJ7_9HYPH|nr:flagellar hook-length control protein FliK [Devosia crocina]SFV27415.1 hook-length control protein FliK [Devosia crocina]